MMVAAGVDATGDVDPQRTDLVLAIEIGKAARDGLGDGDRAGGCQRAVIKPGAGDDVAGLADVG